MACGSCGKRKRNKEAGPIIGAGPKTKIVWFAVGPEGQSSQHDTLMHARAAARAGARITGAGWSIESERVAVED